MNTETSTTVRNKYPNVILLTGSGRERGKTMLGCNIIRKWKEKCDIVAVKISAHQHEDPTSLNLIHRSDGYTICEETTMSAKDSGRFLEAGAGRVFYIEARDQELLDAFRFMYGLCDKNTMIICESGGLGRLIKPAVMLFVQHVNDTPGQDKASLRDLSDRIIYSSGHEITDPSLFLEISDRRWQLVINDRIVTPTTLPSPPGGSGFENNPS